MDAAPSGMSEGSRVEAGDDPTPHHSRPRSAALVAGTAVALALGILAHQWISTTAYDVVWATLASTEAELTETIDEYEAALGRSEAVAARADSLRTVVGGDLVSPELVEALSTDTDALAASLDTAPAPTGPLTGLFDDPAEFSPAWERYADLVAMAEALPERVDALQTFEQAEAEVRHARETVAERVDAVFASARERADAEIAAHPLATYRSVLDVRHLMDGSGVDGQSNSATGFIQLVDAITALRASHAAVEAARTEYPRRAEIEDFARSISQGVTLDFEWEYEVAGVPSDGWYAGTAEFWPEDGGWGHITLTYSIDDSWDDRNAEAVVVHEVGHTQAIRPTCAPIFEGAEFRRDHEMWATAWAIGMGYDLPGAGIEAYGRPSDAQIAAAAQCR
jgi:hypothetical protein